jgi:hypothetical protein
MKRQLLRRRTSSRKIAIFILLASLPVITSCNYYNLDPPNWLKDDPNPWGSGSDESNSAFPSPGEGGSAEGAKAQGYVEDEIAAGELTGQDAGVATGYGELKPVGFVNYGEFDATVRAQTFIPLGSNEPVTPPAASTVSSANDGVGTWPNTSRFISVPMGAYSWCIDWEEGDVDEDGKMDYFHYIQNDPTILDENDSDELDFAEEVSISAPPASGVIYDGKCKQGLAEGACVEYTSQVNVYSVYALEESNAPPIYAVMNMAEGSPPDGIQVSSGGTSTAWGIGMILWQGGDYAEATTSNDYSAFGVQIHGDHTIGWARVLFDGEEIWRGDASAYTIAEGRYGVYVEVRCFPPGTHTMRVEALGINGSGGGMSVPSGYFGFRP